MPGLYESTGGNWHTLLLCGPQLRPPRFVVGAEKRLSSIKLFLTWKPVLLIFWCCLTGSAYPEWSRGQALRSHSNLVQVPRC